MTLIDWLREYDREKEKEIAEMFDSNEEPMFNDLEFFDTYDEKMLKGMNRKSIFYELPYWEHLNISHLLYPMHIFKNVSCYLWHCISSKKSDKLKVQRDLISSNTKKKHWLRQENRGEDGHSFSFKKGGVPRIFKKKNLNLAKEDILGMRHLLLMDLLYNVASI